MEKSRLELHFLYTVIFLVFCLVLVATDRWTGQENFTEYLTNIATMVSLVLALVAIFYSFISNVGLSQSLGNIERVSNDISSTRVSMQEFVRESHAIVESGAANAAELRNVSEQVEREVGSLQTTLAALRSENSALRESLTPIPERIEQLSARLAEAVPATPAAAPAPPKAEGIDPAEQATSLMKRSSVVGVVTLYAISLAHKSSVELDAKRVGEITQGTGTYVHGFIVGLHSMGAITITTVKNKTRVVEVSRADSFVAEFSVDAIRSEVKRRKLATEAEWLERIDKVTAEMAV
jgi:hypothetical protein